MPTPKIEELKLSELVKNPLYRGRSDAEFALAVKDKERECVNGWRPEEPGQYFVRDGQKHLRAGFTRAKACENLGHETGFFVKVEDNEESHRIAPITTNSNRPISAFEQGRIYKAMLDGSDADETSLGSPIFAPMKLAEVAKAVGKTPQHVQQCVAIFGETPEIQELLLSGKISATVATKARGQIKEDHAKRLKYLLAAHKYALSQGDDKATEKHLDAVRADYAPLKVAKSGVEAIKESKSEEAPEERRSQSNESDFGGSSGGGGSDERQELNLIGETESTSAPQRRKNDLRERYLATINAWAEEHNLRSYVSPDDILDLVNKIADTALPF